MDDPPTGEGAWRALQKAIEDEVADYIDAHRDCADEAGHRMVVCNGHKPQRTILCGAGPIQVTQSRVDDRRVDENCARFRVLRGAFSVSPNLLIFPLLAV